MIGVTNMIKRVLAAFAVFAAVASIGGQANGQSIPNGTITQGQAWDQAQWNSAWQTKVDVNNGILINPTIAGTLQGSVVVGSPTGGAQGNGTINAQAIYVQGVAVAAGGAPGGSASNVQFNNGVFGGDSTFNFNSSTKQVTATSLLLGGSGTALSVSSGSILIGSPAGGSQGPGTINAQGGFFLNGVPFYSGVPAGSNTQVQFNASDAFGGDS